MASSLSHQEALIYTMVTMSAVDREMTDVELGRIGEIVRRVPVFSEFDAELLVPLAENCGEVLARDDGLDAILGLIAGGLPPQLRETAYAFAIEIAVADMNVKIEELRFLDLLRDRLDLDKLTTAAIERGARARHQTL